MLKAVIFDFNGIIVNDEPIHFKLFQKVLGEEEILLTEDVYYKRYLGFDDRGAFLTAFRDSNRLLDDSKLKDLIKRKAIYYREAIREQVSIFPGVKELVASLAKTLPLAIASGALRSEIESILRSAGLRGYFPVIVSAEDVARGKPEPEIFLKALAGLNAAQKYPPIQAVHCVVIEDSKEGIIGARRAGMKCLAVTNSHPAHLLADATAVVNSLEDVSLPLLQQLCAGDS